MLGNDEVVGHIVIRHQRNQVFQQGQGLSGAPFIEQPRGKQLRSVITVGGQKVSLDEQAQRSRVTALSGLLIESLGLAVVQHAISA